jgi:metal-responsive CopG/Arc/MetJ family transcriptional regulator
MSGHPRTTISLSRDLVRRLDEEAREQGRPRSDIIRNALDRFFAEGASTRASASRIAQTTEYMQVALDLIVSRDMPEKRDAIIATVAQRLEQFHGGL